MGNRRRRIHGRLGERKHARRDFSAMQRREVYATSGPRIAVRFFGGWSFQMKDAFAPNMPRIGYEKGVPMGQTLEGAGENEAPTFLIAAHRDPEGANLDRVQIVKGWRDEDGELHERVYDVAVSGGRTLEDPARSVRPCASMMRATTTRSARRP